MTPPLTDAQRLAIIAALAPAHNAKVRAKRAAEQRADRAAAAHAAHIEARHGRERGTEFVDEWVSELDGRVPEAAAG
jgi:hypothetical protein